MTFCNSNESSRNQDSTCLAILSQPNSYLSSRLKRISRDFLRLTFNTLANHPTVSRRLRFFADLKHSYTDFNMSLKSRMLTFLHLRFKISNGVDRLLVKRVLESLLLALWTKPLRVILSLSGEAAYNHYGCRLMDYYLHDCKSSLTAVRLIGRSRGRRCSSSCSQECCSSSDKKNQR